MAQNAAASHLPLFTTPGSLGVRRLLGQYFRTTMNSRWPRYRPVRLLYGFPWAAKYPIPEQLKCFGKG